MKTIAALLVAAMLPAAAVAAKVKYEKVEGTLVAADVEAGTFTMKLDDGTQFVTKAEGMATKTIAHAKANARILATFRNNSKGDHVAAVQIKVLRGATRPAAPPQEPAPSRETSPAQDASPTQENPPSPADDSAPTKAPAPGGGGQSR